ncbi:hypothetical protein [Hyalangium gracile]|uniref:hypothetical protein n=1 Tax=Hyalangium gracile TaxID=394092 RepID=UPI001CCFAD17|nr:hypothetical protein [Hyalangium gracile]
MRKTTLFLFSVPLIWGCSAGPLGVDLSARVGARPSGAGVPLEQRLEVGNGITVERVRVLVRKLELEREGDDDDSSLDDDSGGTPSTDDGSKLELEAGPFLVDLSGAALEGGQVVKFTQLRVESGFYDEIEFKVAKISANEVGGSAELAEMQQKQASVIIDGKIDGQPFQFVSGLEVEQEREIRFEVSGDNENVTLSLDPRAWFTGENGSRLDPRRSEARSALEGNIKRSIDAFDDEDHDGGEDHDDDDRDDDDKR